MPAADWEVSLRAFSVDPEARGAPGHRMIGIGPVSVGRVNDREKLAAKIRSKSRGYGQPDVPFVIAVLSLSQADLHVRFKLADAWLAANPLFRGLLSAVSNARQPDGSYAFTLTGPLSNIQSRPGR